MTSGLGFGALTMTRLYEAYSSLYAAPAPAAPSLPVSPIAWLDATQLPVVADGGPIVSMADAAVSRTYTGTGYTYIANAQNFKPAIQSGGSLGYLISPQIDLAAGMPFVIWTVMQTAGSDGQLLWGTGNYQCRFNYGVNRQISMLAYTAIASGNFTTSEMMSWGIWMIHHTATNQYNFYYNGISRNGSTATETLENMFDRLTGTNASGSGFSTKLGELGVALSPSTARLNQLGRYLAAKWAIGWTDI